MKYATIALLLLLLSSLCWGQSLTGEFHSFATPLFSRQGLFLGYEQGFCYGELGNQSGSPLTVDFYWLPPHALQPSYLGQYVGMWHGGKPRFVDHQFSGVHVISIQGALTGTWTPYKYNLHNGRWYLDNRHTMFNVHAWFQDHQVASATELTQEHINGCGGLDVVFNTLP